MPRSDTEKVLNALHFYRLNYFHIFATASGDEYDDFIRIINEYEARYGKEKEQEKS